MRRLPDGTFDPSWGEVIELKEDNYFFKLGEHQQWLMDYITQNPGFIQPDYRRNEVLGFLRSSELEDLCISRPVTRLGWGIPIPFDPNYVTYVGTISSPLFDKPAAALPPRRIQLDVQFKF